MEFDPQKLNRPHVKSCPTASYDISDSLQKLNKNSISQSERLCVLLLDVVGDVELQITLWRHKWISRAMVRQEPHTGDRPSVIHAS